MSARDRAHFDRIAEAMRAEKEARLREAIAQPAVARVIDGLELGDAAPISPAIEESLDRRALAQAELQARARRLGLR